MKSTAIMILAFTVGIAAAYVLFLSIGKKEKMAEPAQTPKSKLDIFPRPRTDFQVSPTPGTGPSKN